MATALITGATGGLGPAVVAAFAAAGWRAVGVARADFDLARPEEAAAAVASAGEELRAVVNVAGGFAAGQPVATTPVEEFEAQFATNLRPTYLVTQAALPRLAAAGGGAIVCVGSRAALHPFAGAAGYCASKAALATFAQVVAQEGAADGVRCNVVLPGVIDTPANRAAGMTGGTPPEELARVIRFLGSDESAPLTGALVPVYPP